MEVQLKLIGIVLMILSLVHAIFPKYFNWADELGRLSLVNRQMMYVHTFFIGLVLFLMGLLCLVSTDCIIHTKLGNQISLGFGVFWLARLMVQFFGYSSKLWKGKRLESIIHIVFSILWLYLSVFFCGLYIYGVY